MGGVQPGASRKPEDFPYTLARRNSLASWHEKSTTTHASGGGSDSKPELLFVAKFSKKLMGFCISRHGQPWTVRKGNADERSFTFTRGFIWIKTHMHVTAKICYI